MKDIRRLVFQLILLLVALFVLYLLVVFVPALHTQSPLRSIKAAPPPNIRPSAESAAIARTPQSFQYLVSVTDRGFEPSLLSIHTGETVRFTNNSGAALKLSGDEAFIGMLSIAPTDFHELTFDRIGEWRYSDTVTGKTGVINVK
jgi:plastocyanin